MTHQRLILCNILMKRKGVYNCCIYYKMYRLMLRQTVFHTLNRHNRRTLYLPSAADVNAHAVDMMHKSDP